MLVLPGWNNMEKKFQIVDHTADIGIICYGKSLQQLFSNAALGLYSLMFNVADIDEQMHRDIRLSAKDRDGLLVDWLNELIYLFDVDRIIFSRFVFNRLNDTSLQAHCFGDTIDAKHQPIKREVKAATYHMLKITQKKNSYQAQVVFDI